jgi:hypothetical protein
MNLHKIPLSNAGYDFNGKNELSQGYIIVINKVIWSESRAQYYKTFLPVIN